MGLAGSPLWHRVSGLARASDCVTVIVQAAHRGGREHRGHRAGAGIDAVFVSYDLSASMGKPGEVSDLSAGRDPPGADAAYPG
jgi:2-keto-3-deoxy-L-rhamnonate aldolase RhmA